MATQVFTDEELEGLRRFPEIGREELFRFFTLTPADVACEYLVSARVIRPGPVTVVERVAPAWTVC